MKRNECQHTKTEEEIYAHSPTKYNQPKTEIPISNYKMGGTSVKLSLISWFFTIPFNFGYVNTINSGLDKCIY